MPTAYLPTLAEALRSVGWNCSMLTMELERGLAAVDEAVTIFQGLRQALPAAFEGNWRSAQQTRIDLLRALRRDDEAGAVASLLNTDPNSG